MRGILHSLWIRRDSNSRPNKEKISFLRCLAITWLSAKGRRYIKPIFNLVANIVLPSNIGKTNYTFMMLYPERRAV